VRKKKTSTAGSLQTRQTPVTTIFRWAAQTRENEPRVYYWA